VYTIATMKDKIPFPKAPITEAVLDIRTNVSEKVDLSHLARFQEKIKERFPIKKERYSWKGGFQIGKGSVPEITGASGGPDGCLFKSKDNTKIAQVRLNGFTFNKLKPYSGWDVFYPEARELWEKYVDLTKPGNVSRLALRYINRIDVPLPIKDFKEYILTVPEIAKGLPQGLVECLMRLCIPNLDIAAHAMVTVSFKPRKENLAILPIIFDIDVFKMVDFNPENEEIWETMKLLRDFKNDIFLKSLTKKTKDMFR